MKPKVLLRPVDYDPSRGDCVTCSTCLQKWPEKLEMSLHPDTAILRMGGLVLGKLRPSEVPVLDVLIRAFPRYLTRAQMLDAVYDSRPDVDVPSPTTITNTIKLISQRLLGTQYLIETDRHLGYRLTSVEQLAAEQRFRDAQMPSSDTALADLSKSKVKRTRVAARVKSVIAASRTASLNRKRNLSRGI